MTIQTPETVEHLLAVVTENVRNQAARAIADTFPHGALTQVERLHGGMSGSLVYRIAVDDVSYVLRIIVHRSPMHDPARQFACMRTAASVGVSPAVHYTNSETGISIADFIAPPPAGQSSLQSRDVAELGRMLRTLHDGPPFPEFLTAFQMIDGGHAQLQDVRLPRAVVDLLSHYTRIKHVLASHVRSTPCHNDLNVGNVLFDGTRQWLIDFDAACMGDPMFDIASFSHWFALDSTRREMLLQSYFNGEPTALERGKLLLMEQVSWCFYTLVFLLISRAADGVGELDGIDLHTLPTFVEALRQIPTGELRIHETEGRRRLALIMAKQALSEIAQPQFEEAVALLS